MNYLKVCIFQSDVNVRESEKGPLIIISWQHNHLNIFVCSVYIPHLMLYSFILVLKLQDHLQQVPYFNLYYDQSLYFKGPR